MIQGMKGAILSKRGAFADGTSEPKKWAGDSLKSARFAQCLATLERGLTSRLVGYSRDSSNLARFKGLVVDRVTNNAGRAGAGNQLHVDNQEHLH